MNENFTKLITLMAFMSCNFNLMADETYPLGGLPEDIPGWKIITEEDGSTLFFPQKMNQAQQALLPEQSIKVGSKQFPTTKPSILDNFPDKIPGWDVIIEPDGSRLLIPKGFVPLYDAADLIASDLSQQDRSMSGSKPCFDMPINKYLGNRKSIWRLDNY